MAEPALLPRRRRARRVRPAQPAQLGRQADGRRHPPRQHPDTRDQRVGRALRRPGRRPGGGGPAALLPGRSLRTGRRRPAADEVRGAGRLRVVRGAGGRPAVLRALAGGQAAGLRPGGDVRLHPGPGTGGEEAHLPAPRRGRVLRLRRGPRPRGVPPGGGTLPPDSVGRRRGRAWTGCTARRSVCSCCPAGRRTGWRTSWSGTTRRPASSCSATISSKRKSRQPKRGAGRSKRESRHPKRGAGCSRRGARCSRRGGRAFEALYREAEEAGAPARAVVEEASARLQAEFKEVQAEADTWTKAEAEEAEARAVKLLARVRKLQGGSE